MHRTDEVEEFVELDDDESEGEIEHTSRSSEIKPLPNMEASWKSMLPRANQQNNHSCGVSLVDGAEDRPGNALAQIFGRDSNDSSEQSELMQQVAHAQRVLHSKEW